MTEQKGRKREPITDAREAAIIALIDDWNPAKAALTREGLVKRIQCKLGLTFTRQGLMKRDAIRLAFERREKEIDGGAKPRAEKEPLEIVLERRIEELKATVEKQDATIKSYEALFLTYRYNARQHGITTAQLEAPIPARDQPEGSRG